MGRRRLYPETGQVVTELILDHPLARGEATTVEYDVVMARGPEPWGPGTHRHEMRSVHSVRSMTIVVEFDPAALPSRVGGMELPTTQTPSPEQPLRLHGSRAVMTGADLNGGGIDIFWTWEG